MDRGLLKIDNMNISSYMRHCLHMVLPSSPICISNNLASEDILFFINRLEVRVKLWLQGRPAADVLMPLLPLHRLQLIGDPVLRWMCLVIMQGCFIFSELAQRSYVVRSDDFCPKLFSLLPQHMYSFEYILDDTLPWWNHNSVMISETKGPLIHEICHRLSCGIKFLIHLFKNTDFSMELLAMMKNSTLLHISEPTEQLHDHFGSQQSFSIPNVLRKFPDQFMLPRITLKDIYEFPEVSNHYSTGCVRRPYHIDDVLFMRENDAWFVLLNRIEKMFTLCKVYSGDPVKYIPALSASSINEFHLSNVLNVVVYTHLSSIFDKSSTKLQILECLHLLSNRPPRQRRLISKYLRNRGHCLGNIWTLSGCAEDHLPTKDHLMTEKMIDNRLEDILIYLSIWYVILGFYLDLYEPYEYLEAHIIIGQLLQFVRSDHVFMSTVEEAKLLSEYFASTTEAKYPSSLIGDNYSGQLTRISHRWQCLWGIFGLRNTPELLLSQLLAHEASVRSQFGHESRDIFNRYMRAIIPES